MRDEEVLVNSQDINTIGDAMAYLSDSISRVSLDVNNINGHVDEFQGQIDDMKKNVSSLENEVRDFMKQMQRNADISNAKQSIMISQLEYDKKYRHRDDVRRRVIGLLQSIDINSVKKNTMESIGEETVVNNPDYWLAPALVALCYWYGNNKEMAQIALKKALARSDEKTSFLFCLIHLRANRIKTAIKWLNRYLSLQDPTNMDCKIILLLDALSTGIFDSEIKEIVLKKIDEWNLQLNQYPEYAYKQVNRWEEYFKSQNKEQIETNNYINIVVKEKEYVNNIIKFSSFHLNMMNEFKKIIDNNNHDNPNRLDKIDKLLNMLVFDYEEEELKLKREIKKNNEIINSGENISDETFNNKYALLYDKKDLHTHISNICLNDKEFEIEFNTKKMALSFSKDYIIKAYKNISNPDNQTDLINLTIAIDEWTGITKNGNNELQLKQDLEKSIENKYSTYINQNLLLNKNTIISLVVLLLSSIALYKYWVLLIIAIIGFLIYNGLILYKNYNYKQSKINEMNKEKETKVLALICTIAEIVDYYFIYIDSNKQENEFINYIDSLNYKDYIKTSSEATKRNIIIGGK